MFFAAIGKCCHQRNPSVKTNLGRRTTGDVITSDNRRWFLISKNPKNNIWVPQDMDSRGISRERMGEGWLERGGGLGGETLLSLREVSPIHGNFKYASLKPFAHQFNLFPLCSSNTMFKEEETL